MKTGKLEKQKPPARITGQCHSQQTGTGTEFALFLLFLFFFMFLMFSSFQRGGVFHFAHSLTENTAYMCGDFEKECNP